MHGILHRLKRLSLELDQVSGVVWLPSHMVDTAGPRSRDISEHCAVDVAAGAGAISAASTVGRASAAAANMPAPARPTPTLTQKANLDCFKFGSRHGAGHCQSAMHAGVHMDTSMLNLLLCMQYFCAPNNTGDTAAAHLYLQAKGWRPFRGCFLFAHVDDVIY
eukprot:364199-Chlamydomonas_euryale.AAC.11